MIGLDIVQMLRASMRYWTLCLRQTDICSVCDPAKWLLNIARRFERSAPTHPIVLTGAARPPRSQALRQAVPSAFNPPQQA
ncbi:Uncharacterized protein AC509_4068 [Pseudomonas amygdali pv. morsprunorum]|nr:Uncharacterized protein AC509_4068 [Pseudomonas amygdali pv. morsprunorum]PPS23933.1 hypothetical protein BVY10_26360 [Pseudomonas amygdali pv. morsprunorum]RMT47405.1 hypothetical protein ALP46_04550 [Pseudomonas amygdali pv. myricae]